MKVRITKTRIGFIFASLFGILISFGLVNTALSGPPAGFITESIFRPDTAGWDGAVGIQFSDAGRMFVWERDGRVWIIDSANPVLQPFLEIDDEVGGWRDFGLLGFTLHPNFNNNGYVYLMYVVDRHHLTHCQEDPSGAGQPICDGTYNPLTDEYFNATIGRITRYTAIKPQGDPDFSNAVTVDYNSRKVLLGETISTGCPILHQSHGTGSILFGHDGTLIASCGDGASYSSVDIGSAVETYYQTALNDGIISAKENIGAYRAQLLDSLSGKLIRVDPMTGDGLASNPFFDSANPRSARSRVWALGLRNAFRFTMRPNSGGVVPDPVVGNPGVFYIGDVGWSTWEDLNIARVGGENFGWPAFEGMNAHGSYWWSDVENLDAPNPQFGIGGCTQEFFYFRDLIQQDTLAAPLSFPNPCDTGEEIPATLDLFLHSRPEIDWRHGSSQTRWAAFNGASAENPGVGQWNTENTRIVLGPTFPGNSSTGGVWYTGTDFPAAYQNTYFHADYGSQWIRSFVMDLATDIALEVKDFDSTAGGVVALATHPTEGGLYFISWASFLNKVSYVSGGDLPPIAVAAAEPTYGPSTPGPTFSVQFTGSDSLDPEGQSLQFEWDFGDGSPVSNLADPLHVYDASSGVPTEYTVSLTVTDVASNAAQALLTVSVNNTPPIASITSPLNGTRYSLGVDSIYNLSANLSDSEFPVNELSCEWVTKLYHNNHVDENLADTSCTSSTTIAGLGCGDEDFHWEVELTVRDPAGLSDFDKVALYPDCAGTGNQPPVAVPDSASIATGQSVTVDVLQNDTDDVGLDASSVSIVSPPSHGTISNIDPLTGAITYTNNGDASPTDTFSYQVLDIDGLPSNSATVDVTIGVDTTPPTDPSNLVATALSHEEIGLTWTGSTDAGGSGLAGYNIYRDGGATPIAMVAGTTHTDGGLISNTAYIYQVSATDFAGYESGLSNAEGATTPPEPGTGIVSGVVKDSVTLQPIQDALVTLQTTTTQSSTAADGSFTLVTASGTDLKIVGARKGYYNASVTTISPVTNVEILLVPVTIGTNASYELVHPETCAICHPNQKAEWDNSAMSNGGINTWVHDIYNGDGTPGGTGGFVYTRDSVHAGTNPDSECAACHQPDLWVEAGFSGRLEGPGDFGYPSHTVEHGISCETCHKIANIDTQKMDFPGIFPGAVTFNLPEPGTQVQYGGLTDVDYSAPDTMEPSYQPQLMAEVCGACHQDKNDPSQTGTFDGVTSEPTYTEWVQSPYGNDPSSPSYTTCIDCHMPPSGETQICTFDPLTRDINTIRSHAIEGTTAAYLDNAVDLAMQTQLVGNTLQVDVTIDNSLTGHHVPTGVTVRNMILLVEAWEDGQDPIVNPLVHTGTQIVHDLGGIGDPAQGYYAGLPGKFYAKVNHDASGQGPTFFTDATGILFDNRIPALGTDPTSYTFSVPDGSDTIHIRARLIYRRAFRFLVDAKGWTTDGHGNPLEDVAGPDYGHLMESATISIACPGCVDFSTETTIPFSNQDTDGNFTVLNGGASIRLDGNTWRQTQGTYTITPDTMLEFDFQSTSQGEVHGIGFDDDNVLSADRMFRVYGTQIWGIADYADYPGSGLRHYKIPVGQYYTGTGMRLVLANDNDAGVGSNSTFSNTRVYESVPPPTPPVINNPGDQFSRISNSVSVTITATDVNGDSLTFSATGLPAGLGITPDGTITGTATTLGTFVVTTTVDDSNGGSDSAIFNWTVYDPSVSCLDCLDFNVVSTISYSSQDQHANVTVQDGGATLALADNTWRRTAQTFNITAGTVLEFDYDSTSVEGEVQGIGFDENDNYNDATRIFQLYGTQNWAFSNHDFDNYGGTGSTQYSVPVGQYYTGSAMNLIFANDFDASGGIGSNSRFSNVRIFESSGGNIPPAMSNPGNQTTVLNSIVNLTVDATDSNPGDILSFSDVGLPFGLTISSSGVISGTATTLGTFNVTITVDDGNGGSNSVNFDWTVFDPSVSCPDCLDFSVVTTSSYSNQDKAGSVAIEAAGTALALTNNTWRKTDLTFTVAFDTVLEFDFDSTAEAEIQGIGFDENENINDATRIFQLYGTQNWAFSNHVFDNYGGSGSTHYSIPVGQYYIGNDMRLVFANDHDAGSGTDSRFSNVRITTGGSGDGNLSPIITNPGAQATGLDDGVNFTINAVDPNIGDTLGFSDGGTLPPGLSISANGDITGSASTAGTYTVTITVNDGNGGNDNASFLWAVCDPSCGAAVLDFNTLPTTSYAPPQDEYGNVTVEDGGATLALADNTWRRTIQTFNITANTVLEFDFDSTAEAEVQGIGFDENDDFNDAVRIFQLYGLQNWTYSNHDFDNYAGGGTIHYVIPVGQHYIGSAMYLVFANDLDAGAGVGTDSRFSNVRIYETP